MLTKLSESEVILLGKTVIGKKILETYTTLDAEMVTETQNKLIEEIIAEKDKSINEFKNEKATMQTTIDSLGTQLAQEKIKNIQKDSTINTLGQEIAKLKIDLIMMKGGN